MFNQLRSELGAGRAAELMGRAIDQRRAQVRAKYAAFDPRDLEGLKQAFLANVSDDGAMFAPEVVRCDGEGLDIKLLRCPRKQAWLDAGLAEEEVAAQVDRGLFDAAGSPFHAQTYRPGAEGCYFLHVRPGTVALGPAAATRPDGT